MNKPVLIATACILAAVATLPAQVISSGHERGQLLDGMARVLENTKRPAGSYAGTPSPFHQAAAPAAPAAAPKPGDTPVAAATGPERLPDYVALGLIAQQFRPLGSLVTGERGLLRLGGGRSIEKGQSFRAEIRGQTYEVTVEDVTSQGYVLRLGSARLERSFIVGGAVP